LDQFEGVDGRLQGLQETLRELTATREHHGIQYGALKLKKRAQNTELEALRKRKKSEIDKLEEAKARLQKIKSKILLAESNRRVALSNKSETIANIEVLEEGDLRKNQKAIEAQRRTIEDFTAQATNLVPTRVEMPEGETTESLNRQYQALTERIKAEEKKQGMTEDEVNKAYAAALAARNQKVADHKTISAISMNLRKSLNIRLEKWRMFQRHITAQSRCNFQYLLAERGFRGKLLFDHRRKCLDLQVEPDKTEKRTDGRSTKTLSGGEKSFSNICLLLSIWEAMGSPLRCLDEFDVFMDNVNRAISTNMLVGVSTIALGSSFG
jgi:chromosome segregation ATPase